MKKNILMVAALSTAMCTASLTSCSDDLETSDKNYDKSSSERLCGYTNLIVAVNEIPTERIELSSGNLKISNNNSDLSYSIEHDTDGYYLLTHVNGSTSKRHHDKVTISNGSKTETMYVTIDPEEVTTRSAAYNATEMNPYQDKACSIIGCSVDYLGNVGEAKKNNVIDLNKFKANDDFREDLSAALYINTNVKGTNSYLAKGRTKSEISEQVEKKMGMKVKFPVSCCNVSAGFDKSHFSETKKTESREYLLANVNAIGFEASLDLPTLCDKAATVAQKSGNSNFYDDNETYACLLSSEVNKILNNAGLTGRNAKEYPATRDGMIKFLKKYGTHVVTSAQFGGFAQVSYDKKESSTSNKIEDFLGFELGLSSINTKTGEKEETIEKKNDDNVSKSVFKTVISPTPPSLTFTNSSKESVTKEFAQIDEHHYTTTKGGIKITGTDGTIQWECGTINEMVPISYATAAVLTDMNNGISKNNETLIPISEFCTDPDRKPILEDLLSFDSDGVMKYYKEVLNDDESSLKNNDEYVVADVKLVYFETTSLDANIYAPMDMTDAKGYTHTYYPVVMNAESIYPKNEVGKVLTLNSYFFTGSDIKGRIVCYYALEPASTCNGITCIRLMVEDEFQKFGNKNELCAVEKEYKGGPNKDIKIIENARTDYGNNGKYKGNNRNFKGSDIRFASQGARHLYVTYGNSETTLKEKIKGVAWHVGNPKALYQGGKLVGKYIGSTGGTEYSLTNDYTPTEYSKFTSYWNNCWCKSAFNNGFFTYHQVRIENTFTTDWNDFNPDNALQPVFSTKSMYNDITEKYQTVNGKVVKTLSIARPI